MNQARFLSGCLLALGLLVPGFAWAKKTPASAPASLPASLPVAELAPEPKPESPDESLRSLPLGQGLPVVVRAGLYVVEVSEIDDNEGTFNASVDLRLSWFDLRLRYDASETPSGFREFRDQAADDKLGEMWSPDIILDNLVGDPSYQRKGLRIYPTGRVEMILRTTGDFSSSFNVENFPFDKQKLIVGIASRRDTQEKVTLDFRQEELNFSKVSPAAEVPGWTLGFVDIQRATQSGWYGETYARIEVSIGVARHPGGSAAAIFIPLLASLLIPLLAMWLNKVEDAEFQIEAFELTNIIIGGLFAVIALNFTVNSEYQMLSGDNTVSRLFVLNYITLAVSLLINLLLFRFNLVKRFFGKYVQEQLYAFFVWSVPLLVLITAAAILLIAMV